MLSINFHRSNCVVERHPRNGEAIVVRTWQEQRRSSNAKPRQRR